MESKNIIEFPAASARHWVEIERTLQDIIAVKASNPEAADFVCVRLRASFDASWAEINLMVDPASLPALQSLEKFFHESQNKLFLELVLAYLEIYRLNHG